MCKRVLSSMGVIILVLCIGFQGAYPVLAQGGRAGNSTGSAASLDVQVLQSNGLGIVVELLLPAFQWSAVQSGSGFCQALALPGWGQSGDPGQPGLPVKGLLIGIPAGASPVVTIEDAAAAVALDGVDLCPAAQLAVDRSLPGTTRSLGESLVRDSAAYALNQEYPAGAPARIGSTEFLRSQRVAQVLLQPVHYNPVTRRLSYVSRLRVRVAFNAGLALAPAGAIDEGPYESVLASTLVNYTAARAWRSQPARLAPAATDAFFPGSIQPAYKITVVQDGIYRVSYADLAAAGAPVDTLDPRNLRLYEQGIEVSLMAPGESDGVFNPGDALLFYGRKNTSRYSDTNAYWLTWDGATRGLRMLTSDGLPGAGSVPASFAQTQRAETNALYLSDNPSGLNADHWYWELIWGEGGSTSGTYTINLPHVSSPAPAQAVLRGLLKGYSAYPQHHTRIYLNGTLVKDSLWPTTAEYSFEVSLSQSLLVSGANTVRVECPLDNGITLDVPLVNWFEVVYARDYAADGERARFGGDTAGTWKYSVTGFSSSTLAALDITDPLHPLQITNLVAQPAGPTYTLVFQQTLSAPHSYAAASASGLLAPAAIALVHPADLHTDTNAADYIIITHPSFLAAVQPLADYHTQHGLRTAVVSVQDIYDEFSGGVLDPEAIHAFLAYAYANWAPPDPAYVLLVGDGTLDFKNYMGRNEVTYVPPYLADVDPWLGETAADNRYVTLDASDVLPDMALGRLPAKSAAEVTDQVNKILNYAQTSPGDWGSKVALVADKDDPAAGSFTGSSDYIALDLLPENITPDKIYSMTEAYPDVALARAATLDAFNTGRLIVHYSGHSAPLAWSGDNLFQLTDLPSLSNTGRLPFVVNMTCLVGYYAFPNFGNSDTALMEAMQRRAATGSVASWAPTGYGLTAGHDLLDQGLFSAIFTDQVLELGLATTVAKYFLFSTAAGNRELIDTFLLFGDPAMRLAAPNPTAVNLISFTAVRQLPQKVEVSWTTANEVNTLGFDVYRSQQDGPFVRLNGSMIPANLPGTPAGSDYVFVDQAAPPGVTYTYRLMQVDRYQFAHDWGSITFGDQMLYIPVIVHH